MYEKLLFDGWVDIQQSFADLAILVKGQYRILFDKKRDIVYLRYEFLW